MVQRVRKADDVEGGGVTTYYNENDPKTALWLKQLISDGHLPQGDVDTRSISEVKPEDLANYDAHHFFAGIGGWPYALQLADWNDPMWTGSCPCQPFSVAGRGLGEADPRHLWPVWRELIKVCRPATILGEQVASPAGRKWLAGVFADLEAMGYAVAGADLCAAGIGAPHIRQRLYWMADTQHTIRRPQCRNRETKQHGHDAGWQETHGELGACGEVRGLGITNSARPQPRRQTTTTLGYGNSTQSTSDTNWLGNADATRPQGRCEHAGEYTDQRIAGASSVAGDAHWANAIWHPCLDGKQRRIEPSAFPLAHGVPERVVRLRGYGNAIVPQVAAKFVRAAREAMAEQWTNP
jgi:DNA (cytosine-5)-methyltransferase 1